ncbi:MAG: VOC family protein, partial [Thermoleophilaceae bacterium]|jgi:predicted enzyme related to lactoylglutathione lyase
MFSNVHAFSSFAVDDLDTARSFYGETLGLTVSDGPMGVLSLDLPGDRSTLIYPKADFAPATYTILNFPVEDVEAAVDELTARGIAMERYDGFDQDEKGIARDNGPTIAWFRDPAGNILAVLQAD